jgi:hypothetical protein
MSKNSNKKRTVCLSNILEVSCSIVSYTLVHMLLLLFIIGSELHEREVGYYSYRLQTLLDLSAYPPPALALADALPLPAIALELALAVNGNLSSKELSLKYLTTSLLPECLESL